jgi:RNA polymerase sigma-70 factor (ECF subfamily)
MRHAGLQESCVTLPDEQLISRAIEGQISAYSELYRKYVPLVYAFLRRCTGKEEDAEDLTQDVFIQAWRQLGQFEFRSAFSTWLISIAISRFRSRLRSKRRRENRQIEWHISSIGKVREADTMPEELIDLENAIGTLPPRGRMVLALHEINGYRHSEIAQMMGITEGASKAHLNRAKQTLRRRLDR